MSPGTLFINVFPVLDLLTQEVEAGAREKQALLEQVTLINDQYKTLDAQLGDMKQLFEAQEVGQLYILMLFVLETCCFRSVRSARLRCTPKLDNLPRSCNKN